MAKAMGRRPEQGPGWVRPTGQQRRDGVRGGPAETSPEHTADLRRVELARFLRSHRHRMPPPDGGDLSVRKRRRTPGMRREEIAALAGMSLTWYTWLEQGRSIRVSRRMLSGLADALHLERPEVEHLFRLAGEQPPSDALGFSVSLPYRILVQHLDPFPAALLNQRLDILAWNDGCSVLFPHIESTPPEQRNKLRMIFRREMRELFPDWYDEAAAVVTLFRILAADRLAEPEFAGLVAELHAEIPEFRALWRRVDLAGPEPSWRVYQHPLLGRIRLNCVKMYTADNHNTLVVHQPEPGSPLAREFAVQVEQRRKARAAARS